ncbi:D-xylose ABC transporter substrate-binding protein [Paenibacillus sacheonensis]|uniref:D-xylose ABC transporter substrate-binding protein n=1 Tax=Paenibacillus sacheonensis TaxID=742054 RepID=A0A7X4YKE7_9BACL|nr:D-xylose ABC transporter substrate-binding protein [Paenibacillus sacheonensis]MBM7563430.1 D-xylose transport system substrate-binding protein [Paenibacillus sacheonensis]NBC68015.1 D-xylose ABC transporter substrate-binding protein [Paenibacillus sacheonensis]
MKQSFKQSGLAGVFTVLLTLLSACSSGGQGAGSGAKPAAEDPNQAAVRELVVGLSLDTLLEERWKKDRDLFKAAVEKLGAKVDVQAANGDDAKQIAQAENMISKHVDVLVVVPHDAQVSAAIVAKAHQAGVKVISYDRLILNADVDLYVSFDNEKVGELQAEALVSKVPRGNYVLIEGADTDNNAHMFKRGQMKVLQPLVDRGDIQIVYDQFTKEWKPVNALANMKTALAANRDAIDAVIAANDGTAGGVVGALAERRLAGTTPVTGMDAELAAAQRIVEGTQTMTVYKPIRKLAETAAALAVQMAEGKKVSTDKTVFNKKIDVPAILLEPIAVNRTNIDATIIADGFHSREDVYRNVDN